jgi:hypothetical protein
VAKLSDGHHRNRYQLSKYSNETSMLYTVKVATLRRYSEQLEAQRKVEIRGVGTVQYDYYCCCYYYVLSAYCISAPVLLSYCFTTYLFCFFSVLSCVFVMFCILFVLLCWLCNWHLCCCLQVNKYTLN